MITINQGGNAPIELQFDIDIENTAVKLSALLYKKDWEIKRWSISDIDISGNTVILPMTEEETLDYPSGKAKLSVKILDNDSNIIFYDEIDCIIIEHTDKTPLIGLR